MADNKKYYYLKLKDNFFDDEKIIILESLPDGYLYANILMKMYLKSLKGNGRLMFNERIPYNSQLLAQLTRHSVGVIEKAIDIFLEFELIEVMNNGAIYITNIQNFIGSSSSEADRQREYQRRLKESKGIDSKEIIKIESCKKSNGETNDVSNDNESNKKLCKKSNIEPNENGQCKKSNIESCKESNADFEKVRKESNKISTPEIRDKRLEIRDKNLEIRDKRLETRDLDYSSDPAFQILEQAISKKKAEIEKYKKTDIEELEPIGDTLLNNYSEIEDYLILTDEDIQYFVDCWNNIDISGKIKKLTDKQIEKLKDNVNQFGIGQEPKEKIDHLFDSITDSLYLLGEAEHEFKLMINWVLKPENWEKIISGDYESWGGVI
ncbi:phage replisome organizer N-terminal domain-containing protein [Eubacteriaceae bacterium ES3]|nr:phage replisome organizer N-terminal domain-containing protein [Eubacteriaceae bacterium ES3]